MAGVFDLSLAATAGHDGFVRELLDGMPEDHPDRYAIASPIEHLPVGLPVTAVHGTADQTVNPVQSRSYVEASQPPVILPSCTCSTGSDTVSSATSIHPRGAQRNRSSWST